MGRTWNTLLFLSAWTLVICAPVFGFAQTPPPPPNPPDSIRIAPDESRSPEEQQYHIVIPSQDTGDTTRILILDSAGNALLVAPDAGAFDTIDLTVDLLDQAEDLVFVEIELDDGEVVAIDTAGNWYVYDFQEDRFISGEAAIGITEVRSEDILLEPPEIRCTTEVRVETFQETVMVGVDEYVDGDIRAYGAVTVRGWVQGDIQSLSGRVLVTETGQVDGNIEAPRVIARTGAVVAGEVREVDIPIPGEEVFSAGGIWVVFGFSVLILFLGVIGFTLVPTRMERMADCISNFRARTYAFGILLTLGFGPLLALVAITIVGLLILWLVPLAYILAMMLGTVFLSRTLGRLMLSRFGGGENGLLNFIAGLGVFLLLWYMVAVLLGSSNPVAVDFGIALLIIAILITTYPLCTGLGAALLTRFGHREYQRRQPASTETSRTAPKPAPPPIPSKPPRISPISTGISQAPDLDDPDMDENAGPDKPDRIDN